jgi:uncharacterized membrane protein YhaH (DUF805 family)
MKGNVIGFDPDTNTGAISGHDGRRYDFVMADWHDRRHPTHGDTVDFVPTGQQASQVYLIEPEYVQPSWGEFLFSAQGRIARYQYWLHWVVPIIVTFVVLSLILNIAFPDSLTATVVLLVLELIILWPAIAIYIKRAHDRGRSGWFILLFLVPILNFWPLIELLFVRGTVGANRFGPDPVPRT